MTINKGMLSSKHHVYETPAALFKYLNYFFNFTLDVCATADNAKCKKYYSIADDGLSKPWARDSKGTRGACWMNPPYGDPELPCKKDSQGKYICTKKKCILRGFHVDEYVPGITDWMDKALLEARRGARVVCLVPARTDSQWWHEYATKGQIISIKGRLRFNESKNSAPFPSALVIFDPFDLSLTNGHLSNTAGQ
jgi:phage N-6-adenine-methyltransferase